MCNEKGPYIVPRMTQERQESSALQKFKEVARLAPDATEEEIVAAVRKVVNYTKPELK